MYDFLNLILLMMIAGLILQKGTQVWRRGDVLTRSNSLFHGRFQFLPTAACALALIIWYLARYVFSINIVEASASLFFLYGLLGFYLPSSYWKKSIIPFGLLLMTLPFGNIMDVYLGFPLRILAVDLVSNFLQAVGIPNVSQSTIILMENKATQVDFSCSGLKGLWTGLIFFFSLSWLENLKIGFRWLMGFGVLVASLLSVNLLRILILSLLSTNADWQPLADLVHIPLGIVGFVFSCLLIYFLLKSGFFPSHSALEDETKPWKKAESFHQKEPVQAINWKALLGRTSLLLVIGLLAFAPAPPPVEKAESMAIQFPADWEVEDVKVGELEAAFFKEQGSSASKYKFKYGEAEGILLFIKTKGWRGHHHPEYCFQADGHHIEDITTQQVAVDFPVKRMQINGRSSAYYWFQNPQICTDDFSTRMWAEMYQQEKDWVQVSLVLHNDNGENRESTTPLLLHIRELLNAQFTHQPSNQKP